MILIMKILLHNVYKIINLLYPTYVYPFLVFLIITKIECWPVFKQDPKSSAVSPAISVGQSCHNWGLNSCLARFAF